MPTYDYECEACDHEFEAFHAMSAGPLIDCPKCDQPKLIKLIGGGAAVIVRGTATPCRGGRSSKTQKKQHKYRLGEGKYKGERPFWRDGPVNKEVLKNPEKYIEKGRVD